MVKYPRLVSWTYYSGGLFGANDKERLTEVWLLSPEGESVVDRGICPSLEPLSKNAPYFKVKKIDGYTKRARKYGTLKRKMVEKYPDLENKMSSKAPLIMPFGEYVYIDLLYINNYNNPLVNSEGFYNAQYVKKDKFTVDFVLKLLSYIPCDLYGREIKEYQEKELPKFMRELKIEYPKLYNQVWDKSDKLKKIDDEITYVGTVQKVKTLLPGKVRYTRGGVLGESLVAYWDGDKLTGNLTYKTGEVEEFSITPTDDTEVVVLEDKVIDLYKQ